jgi:PilZ domain
VDPNIHPEQSGLSHSAKGDEGVNYLRRLKGAGSAAAAAPPMKNEGHSATATPPHGKERRLSARLRCSGSAEFRAWGSNVHMWGTLTDISLHGCYMEMNNTFPVNTKVDLVLKSCGVRIEVSGSVRTSYPALGMGIGFVDIKPDQQLQLNQLLSALGGQSAFFRGAPERDRAAHQTVQLSDPQALLDEITEFFQKHAVLSRDQFNEIARRFRRS